MSRICSIEPELLVQFADGGLLCTLSRFDLATWHRDLPPMPTVHRTPDQQHLTVVRVGIRPLAPSERRTRTDGNWGDEERHDDGPSRRAFVWRVQVDGLQLGEDLRRECFGERQREGRELPTLIAPQCTRDADREPIDRRCVTQLTGPPS